VKKRLRITTIDFKKSKALLGIFLGAVLLQLTACNSYKNIPYFKDIPSDSISAVYKDGVQINTVNYQELKIQPNDILSVTIQTIDAELNSSLLGGESNGTVSSLKTGNNAEIPGYLVDANGYIEIPVAGKIKVGGLTTAEAREHIREKASVFFKNPIVNVRIANFKVTVIGEVLRPGAYLINGERASLLDALGEAGDLTIYGQRKNVLLARKEGGKQRIVRFDLTSSNVYDSPYFYLKQGDVIYVQPSKAKANSSDGTLTRTYALISSTLALVVVIATRNY